MTREEIITAITPAWMAARNMSEAATRAQFHNWHISDLQRAYDRQVEAGHIKPPHSTPAPPARVPEDIAAKAKQAAAQSEVARENQRLKRQIELDQALFVCLNTPINGKYAANIEANRKTIIDWFEAETNQIPDVQKWWTQIFNTTPSLTERLAWSGPPLSKEERQQQEQESLKADAEKFYSWARTTKRISTTHANFLLCREKLGPGLRNLEDYVVDSPQPWLITDDDSFPELTPPSKEELHKWETELFEEDQSRLREMARSGDIASLRARAKREALGQRPYGVPTPAQDAQTNFEYSVLKAYSDRAEFNFPPLPDRWIDGQTLDASFIRKASVELMKQLVGKFGFCQLNARLHQLPKDFFTNYASKLRDIEERLGFRSADFFSRQDELRQAVQNQNRNR
jgi:hypothetical protein